MKKSLLFSTAIIIAILAIWMILIPKNNLSSALSSNGQSENEEYKNSVLTEYQKNVLYNINHELEMIHTSTQVNLQLVSEAIAKYGANSIEVKNLSETKSAQDLIHLKKVTKLLDKHGWLSADKIGSQNNYTLFATIQCADFETQDKYLGIMEAAVKSGSLSAEYFANLIDRKALAQHHQQIYGTQFIPDSKSGAYCLAPVIEETSLNQRRAEIGLPPIEAYAIAKQQSSPLLQKSI